MIDVSHEHDNIIKDAWGMVYSTNHCMPKFYLTDYKGTFWLNNKGSLFQVKKTSHIQDFIYKLTNQKLFKIKRHESDDGDLKICILPKCPKGVEVNGILLQKETCIKKGRCEIKLIEHDVEMVFEAFCEVSGNDVLNLISDKFRIISSLGKGGFGRVYKGLNIEKETFCAIKTSLEPCCSVLPFEYKMFDKLQHKNLIKLLDYLQFEKYQFLITELAEGGSLYYRINNGPCINECYARGIFRHLCRAIFYLHSHRILHRDLKPENVVLMTDGHNPVAKIIDLGVSCYIKDAKEMAYCVGAYRYMAPEVLSKKLGNKKVRYTDKVDIWGLGIILFLTLTRNLPFNWNSDLKEYRSSMKKGKMNTCLQSYRNLSPKTQHVLQKCLRVDPVTRPSIHHLLLYKWP